MPLDFPDSTNPTQETKVFRSAINAIAKTYRLRRDRMNDVVAAFIPPLSTESLMLWHDYPNLQVYVPQADCMLALKLLAGRERDAEDIAALCAQLAIQTREQAQALVDRYAERRWQRINFLASPLVRRTLEQVMEQISRNRAFHSVLWQFFPQYRAAPLEKLAIFWQSGRRFSFDALESQTPLAINRVDLLNVLPFYTHDIPLAETVQLLIRLIPCSSLAFAWQIMIPSPGSTRTKGDLIEVLSVIGHHLASLVGGDAQGIDIMRFRQVSRFAQRGRLVAKERGKGGLRAERGIEIAFALHRALGDLIQLPTHTCHLERDRPLVDLVMAGFTQGQ